jgi:hypothetical protein
MHLLPHRIRRNRCAPEALCNLNIVGLMPGRVNTEARLPDHRIRAVWTAEVTSNDSVTPDVLL